MKNAPKAVNVRRGFSMLEAVVALLLTGILMTGVVYTLGNLVDTAGQTTSPQQSTSDWQRAAAEFTADMVAATSCDTQGLSTATESLSHHEITVYADDNGDAIPDRVRWHTDNTTLFRDVHYATAECSMPATPDSTVAVATNLDPTATAAGILTASRSNETLTYPTLTSCVTRPTPCTLDYITLTLSLQVNDLYRAYTVGSAVGVNRASTRLEGLAAVSEPGTPAAPTVTDGTGAGTANITWTPPLTSDGVTIAHGSHPIDRWHISYSTDPTFTTETIEQTALYSPWTYTLTGLTDGTPIYVRIAAESAAGISGYSPAASGTPIGFPAAPTSVQANLNPIDFTEATFSFTGPTDLGGGTLSHFELQTSVDGGPWSPTPPTSNGSATTGTAIAASPAASSIAVRVRTVNEEGPSPWATGTAVMFPAPTAPQNLTGSAVGTTLDFAFDPPADDGGTPITGYLLSYAIDGGPTAGPASIGMNTAGAITLPTEPATDVVVNIYAQTRAGDSTAATTTVTPVSIPTIAEFLIVAGGGGTGTDQTGSAKHWRYSPGRYCYPPHHMQWEQECVWYFGVNGGGGGGGVINSVAGETSGGGSATVAPLTPKADTANGVTYSITVGQGGALRGNSTRGTNGGASTLSSSDGTHAHVARGGGSGGAGDSLPSTSGANGGSGGGGGRGVPGWEGSDDGGNPNNSAGGGSGTTGQGYNGAHGGGGGGAGSVGGACRGGAPLYSSITGTSRPYAAGGGRQNQRSGGPDCGYQPSDYGRGGQHSGAAQPGVVIIRFTEGSVLPTVSGSLAYTTSAAGGYTVMTFTSGSGTLAW